MKEVIERMARKLFDTEWGAAGGDAEFESHRDYWETSARACLKTIEQAGYVILPREVLEPVADAADYFGENGSKGVQGYHPVKLALLHCRKIRAALPPIRSEGGVK